MPTTPTVVISTAGRGARLGLGLPKALVSCAGRFLIEWQLDLCKDIDDLVVVVGHQRSEVADVVFERRPDALIVVNHRYQTTGTAASLRLGAEVASGDEVISLDGDLLVHPEDWAGLLKTSAPLVGIGPARSRDPVLVELDRSLGKVTRFFRGQVSSSSAEWTGLCRVPRSVLLSAGDGHVYRDLEPLLPLPALSVRTAEVDYPEEIAVAESFLTSYLLSGDTHG